MDPKVIIFVVYIACTVILLLIVSLIAFRLQRRTPNHKHGISVFLKSVWGMRRIYGAVLVHIYDTSTDYIILISWSLMARDEITGITDYEHVNMLSFVIPSVLLIFVYRIVYAVRYHTLFQGNTVYRGNTRDIIAILADVYIFVLVYQCVRDKYLTPCLLQKQLHLLESVFESMPQLVLQSIYLIRTYGTSLAGTESTYFIWASIGASVLSIYTKFLHEDQQWIIERASSAHCTYKRCPCISVPYLIVSGWRICETVTRFAIFTLLWSVVGGLYLVFYLIIDIIGYLCLARWTSLLILSRNGKQWKEEQHHIPYIMCILQSVVGIPLRPKPSMIAIRFMDNLTVLSIITIFAFLRFDCMMCYDMNNRAASSNPYVRWLLVMAGFSSIFQPLLFCMLHSIGVIALERRVGVGNTLLVDMDKLNDRARRGAALHPMIMRLFLVQHTALHTSTTSTNPGPKVINITKPKLTQIHDNSNHDEAL